MNVKNRRADSLQSQVFQAQEVIANLEDNYHNEQLYVLCEYNEQDSLSFLFYTNQLYANLNYFL